jgi:hypothetical protein
MEICVLDEKLEKKIKLVAVGVTASTFLRLKTSTIDVDFTGPEADLEAFKEVLNASPHAIKCIFSLMV